MGKRSAVGFDVILAVGRVAVLADVSRTLEGELTDAVADTAWKSQ